jgi:hypothetical protein
MNKVYIYSTSSCDNNFTIRDQNGNVTGRVTIAGKANITDKFTLITREGALTVLDQDKYDLIKDDYFFKSDIENGFTTVEQKKVDVEKVIKNMTKKDKSAQSKKSELKNDNAQIIEE